MFDREKNRISGVSPATACNTWSMLLPDAADGLLSQAEQTAFDGHIAQCPACAEELAEARRGAAWLDLLKDQPPEPPPALLGHILAQTSGLSATQAPSLPVATRVIPAASLPDYPLWTYVSSAPPTRSAQLQSLLARWFGLDQTFAPTLHPRLAMTGAMAFFSLCLTLNLLGFSLRDVRAGVLHPASTLQRTAADTGASLVRSFEGIRVVYRMESRVNQWRAIAEASQPSNP